MFKIKKKKESLDFLFLKNFFASIYLIKKTESTV